MATRGRVVTGARARLKIEGVDVALCTNVSFSEEIEHQAVEVLNQYEVAEHVPVAYRVTFSAQLVRQIQSTVKLRDGVTIFPRLEDIIAQPDLTATIHDNVTDTVLATVQRVRATRYNTNIPAKGIVMNDVEFVAIRVQDETETT